MLAFAFSFEFFSKAIPINERVCTYISQSLTSFFFLLYFATMRHSVSADAIQFNCKCPCNMYLETLKLYWFQSVFILSYNVTIPIVAWGFRIILSSSSFLTFISKFLIRCRLRIDYEFKIFPLLKFFKFHDEVFSGCEGGREWATFSYYFSSGILCRLSFETFSFYKTSELKIYQSFFLYRTQSSEFFIPLTRLRVSKFPKFFFLHETRNLNSLMRKTWSLNFSKPLFIYRTRNSTFFQMNGNTWEKGSSMKIYLNKKQNGSS